MNDQKIYPEVDEITIKEKATKSKLGHFFKQYKKGDWIYTVEKKPFEQETIAALHIPTKRVFGFTPFLGTWFELPHTFDEYSNKRRNEYE